MHTGEGDGIKGHAIDPPPRKIVKKLNKYVMKPKIEYPHPRDCILKAMPPPIPGILPKGLIFYQKNYFGVPHLATCISFSNVIASFAYTIQYTGPGLEPTTTPL
jgi:hypothetical protein